VVRMVVTSVGRKDSTCDSLEWSQRRLGSDGSPAFGLAAERTDLATVLFEAPCNHDRP
jgi:hypothetical protein